MEFTYKEAIELLESFVNDWNCQEMCSQRIPKILDRRYQAA